MTTPPQLAEALKEISNASGATPNAGIKKSLQNATGNINAYVSSLTPPAPKPSPAVPTGASGIPVPIDNIAGKKLLVVEDFNITVPVGGFGPSSWPGNIGSASVAGLTSEYETKLAMYPDGWKDTSGNGTYSPSKVLSAHDSCLDWYLHSENGVALPAVVVVKIPGSVNGQLYGRYEIAMKADPVIGYKTAFLLWPDDGTWPKDGEIDFPEGDLKGSIGAYVHHEGATSGSDQDGYGSTILYSQWNHLVIEWEANEVQLSANGSVLGTSTSRIPNTPMHWCLQVETSIGEPAPTATAEGHVLVDWIALYGQA